MNGWTEERRKHQRELIDRWKPWLKSTGAKTAEGKAKSSKNASKDGTSTETRKMIRLLNQLLKRQKKLI